MRRVLGLATAAMVVVLSTARAHAQPSGQDVATAQALFEDGKRLMQEGKYDEGCPKLVESQRLDPGGGTLLAIALCHEGQGKTATAWADFNVALGQARKDARVDREQTATEHIKALEPKLTRVRVVVLAKAEGLEVKRDGTLVGEAQWNTPLPVDPGDHLFEATAPAKQKWSETIPLRGEGQTVDVKIPPLAELEVSPYPVTTAPKHEDRALPPKRASDEDDASDGSSQRLWGGIVAGVGVVGIAVGSVFGLSASSKWSDAKRANDDALRKDAGSAADASTIFFTVGAVGLVAGAVLWFTAPSKPASSSAVRRLLLEGAF